MVGAILGDIIGSRHEFHNIKTKEFDLLTEDCYFTDDTVMTCAVAQALVDCDGDYSNLSEKATDAMRRIGRKYPRCGFGGMFFRWVFTNTGPYNSFGNGSAMRVSPVAYVAKSLEEVKDLSYKVTSITHNHPEGLKGAEATAVATYMALHGATKDEIKEVMERDYYVSEHTVDEYREIIRGHGDETCMVSMPEALQCFYEGTSYEDVIRNCVSIGGDSDTLGAIAGAIAEAYFGVPEWLRNDTIWFLDGRLQMIVDDFRDLVGLPRIIDDFYTD